MKPFVTRALLFVVLGLVSVLALGLAFTQFQQFMFFAAAILKVAISVAMLWAIDTYLLPELDIIDEIRKNNITYGLAFLGLCIIVAMSISTA